MPIPLMGKMVRILKAKTFHLADKRVYEVCPQDVAICVSEAKTFEQADLKDINDTNIPAKHWYRVYVKKDPGSGFDIDIPCDELGIYYLKERQVVPIGCNN